MKGRREQQCERKESVIRVLHMRAPFLHGGLPVVSKDRGLRYHIRCIQRRVLCLVWGWRAHAPKETTFGIWVVTRDVQGPFRRIEARDDVQTGLVNCTPWLFSVLERDPDLI